MRGSVHVSIVPERLRKNVILANNFSNLRSLQAIPESAAHASEV